MFKVIDGKIVERSLPRSGCLKTGQSVSGYDKLMLSDPKIAKEEGWLPVKEIIPKHDPKTHILVLGSEKVLTDRIEVTYVTEAILIADPTEKVVELPEIEARLKGLEAEEIKRNPDYKVPVVSV